MCSRTISKKVFNALAFKSGFVGGFFLRLNIRTTIASNTATVGPQMPFS